MCYADARVGFEAELGNRFILFRRGGGEDSFVVRPAIAGRNSLATRPEVAFHLKAPRWIGLSEDDVRQSSRSSGTHSLSFVYAKQVRPSTRAIPSASVEGTTLNTYPYSANAVIGGHEHMRLRSP